MSPAGRSPSARRAWVEDAASLAATAEEPARWEALRAYVTPRLLAAGVDRAADVAELIGALGHCPPRDPDGVLAAVRDNALAMRRELTAALAHWLRAEAAAAGLLLVLEDLHWADPMTLGLLEDVWESLDDRAILLVATSWPDAAGARPPLTSLKGAPTIKLDPLGVCAAERLARQVLGPERPAADIERVARMSSGNAFLLEEILRAAAQGAPLDAMPDSVLAVVQSRLRALPWAARRCLRAASVFGERFREGDVAALLAGSTAADDAREALQALRREELVVTEDEPGRGDERAWTFRHSLVREAAYESLSPADRAETHLVAGRWLAARRDVAPVLVADQFARGGERAEAAEWFLRAVRDASLPGDFDTVLALARRSQCDGVAPLTSARHIYHEGYALLVRGRLPELIALLDQLDWSLYPRGSAARFLLRATDLGVRIHAGHVTDVTAELQECLDAGVGLEVTIESTMAITILLVTLMHIGLVVAADAVASLLTAAPADPARDFDFLSLRDHYLGCYHLSSDRGAGIARMRSAHLRRAPRLPRAAQGGRRGAPLHPRRARSLRRGPSDPPARRSDGQTLRVRRLDPRRAHLVRRARPRADGRERARIAVPRPRLEGDLRLGDDGRARLRGHRPPRRPRRLPGRVRIPPRHHPPTPPLRLAGGNLSRAPRRALGVHRAT